MNKKEFYTAIVLITIMLVAMISRQDTPPHPLNKHHPPVVHDFTIDTSTIKATTDVNNWQATANRKRKPSGQGWLDAYGVGIIFNYRPKWDERRKTVAAIFPESSTQSKLAEDVYNQNPVQDIIVEVLNGCGVPSLASKTTGFLRSKQFDVVKSGNANHQHYQYTLMIQRNEKFESLKKIADSFSIELSDTTHIKIIPDDALGVDVTVILGEDYTTFTELIDYISANPTIAR